MKGTEQQFSPITRLRRRTMSGVLLLAMVYGGILPPAGAEYLLSHGCAAACQSDGDDCCCSGEWGQSLPGDFELVGIKPADRCTSHCALIPAGSSANGTDSEAARQTVARRVKCKVVLSFRIAGPDKNYLLLTLIPRAPPELSCYSV